MSRLYDRSFIIAVASQSLFVLANTLLAVHYARWITFLGGDVRDVGYITGAAPVIGLLLRPWIGQWIDRLGSVTCELIGYSIFMSAALANLWLDSIGPAIYILRTLGLVGAALIFASTLTYVAQKSPPERRSEAIGILGAGGFLGMIVGPYLGDVLLGTERTYGDFVELFVCSAVACLLPILALFMLEPHPRGAEATPISLRDFSRTVRSYWPGTILLVNIVFGMSMTIPLVFLVKYLDVLGLEVGRFFLAYAGWGLLLRVALRRLPDRIGNHKVLMVGLLFMAAGMYSFLIVDAAHSWRLIIPALVCGTGHSLMFHTMTALALQPFPIEARGAGSVLSLMMLDFGQIGGAPILGELAYSLGYHWLFVLIGSACLAVAALFAWRNLPALVEFRQESSDVSTPPTSLQSGR